MKTVIMILMAMVMATGTTYGQTTDQPPPIPSEEQPEVLTRGPVNEAFAQPIDLEEESGFIAPKAPPPDIEEAPPAERPVGGQFAWVPGYWAWDSGRNGYIWVSGCWRAVPPGKYWVPGYWTEVADGWRWVAGFWAPVSEKNIEYLPAPPVLSSVEPSVTEGPDEIWVPPCWYWSYDSYTLRPGYWIAARKNWIWVPSHYVWTPRGYVFVSGYWDYPLSQRGVLFAPVYFPGDIYRWLGRPYSLYVAVDLGNLEFSLFTRPRYCHYYFGDYYDSFYIGMGIFPWYECESRHTWYDPIYLHDRWRHRRDERRWQQHVREQYTRRRADKNLRPPRTYREMERRMRNMTESRRRSFEIVSPMKRFIEKNSNIFTFRRNRPEARREISRQYRDVQKYIRERRQWESPATFRRTRRPGMESVPSVERREKRAPMGNRRPGMKPLERGESSRPGRVQKREAPARGREGSMLFRGNEKPSNASRREEKQDKSDNVKVRTSPVVGKQKSMFSRKRPPSQPAEEQERREKREKRNHQR